ncbi:MAG: chondroitinase-B domain-containing protein [Bacteroidota bacterium]
MKLAYINTILLFYFILSLSSLWAQTFDDPDDLANAVNASANGGVFVVKDGTYNDFEATFEIIASSTNPVIIKAETIGGVTLTGESHVVIRKSAFVTLEGFVFDGQGDNTLVKLEGSNNIRITRNVFELASTESIKWVFIGGVWNDNTYPFNYPSHHNRIDHNIFQNKNMPGHYITVDGSFDNTGSEEVYYQSQYDRIDHNHFKNNGPRAVNEQESIRIGWSEMSLSSGFTVVEHNLFEDCDGDPEIVSVKSCDNIIRHNTFRKSYGTLSLRHGNRNRVEGNYFFGDNKPVGTSPAGASLYTGGIRIYGTDHLIINNYMEGLNGTRWDAPLTLTLGDAIDGQSSNLSKHFRAERVSILFNTLVNNTHGIEIGYDNNNKYNKDLEGIKIANNLISGSENSLVEIVDTQNDQGSNISWINNLMYPTGNATTLTGATSTTFDTSEVVHENPFLEWDSSIHVWRTTLASPLYENTLNIDSIGEDIEGQERPLLSNPGADHYSTSTIRFRSLTANDVGPFAVEGNTTSISPDPLKNEGIVYPVPAKDILYVKNFNPDVYKIELFNGEGKIILSQIMKPVESMIDVSSLTNGIYFVKVLDRRKVVGTYKISVQH